MTFAVQALSRPPRLVTGRPFVIFLIIAPKHGMVATHEHIVFALTACFVLHRNHWRLLPSLYNAPCSFYLNLLADSCDECHAGPSFLLYDAGLQLAQSLQLHSNPGIRALV
jgi:hypothetical protein